MYTENLENYENLENTLSCYLDGRYFNKVFVRYPGLLVNPLNVTISKTKISNVEKDRYYVNMKQTNIDTSYPGLLRLVIKTPNGKHSNLLIIDYDTEKVYRFEPLGKNAPYYDTVNELITSYLGKFFNIDLEMIDLEIDEIYDQKNPRCKKSGFCVAYIIMYAYDFLNQKDFNPTNILKFASLIEKTYGSLPNDAPEIEYGLFDRKDEEGRTGKMLLGTGIGALGGGLLTGSPVGVGVGALGGLAIGSII